jgi:rhodanese-related sulfurtransferase
MAGNVPGSINIPLPEITKRIDEIKSLHQPIVVCCASGVRSQQAFSFLQPKGIDCSNGGSWVDLKLKTLLLN